MMADRYNLQGKLLSTPWPASFERTSLARFNDLIFSVSGSVP
jgi:hypothetical protein